MNISLVAKTSLLLLLALMVISGCQARQESIPGGKNWGEPSNGLRCSIDLEKTQWTRGNPVLVSVIVENVSGSHINLTTIPAFTLNGDRYWCPVDIFKEGYALPPNGRSTVYLEKGAAVNKTIDISRVKWGNTFAATWPDEDFYSLLPSGQYKLGMDIEIVGNGLSAWIRSNEVNINISE